MNGGTQGWDRLGDGKGFPHHFLFVAHKINWFLRSNFRNCEIKAGKRAKSEFIWNIFPDTIQKGPCCESGRNSTVFLNVCCVCFLISVYGPKQRSSKRDCSFGRNMKSFRCQWTVCNMHCPIPNKLICGLWHMFICFCKEHRLTQLFIMCVLPVFPSHVWLSSLSGGPTSCGCS